MAPRKPLDLTLYLVTDSTPAILGASDLIEVVKAALNGGVTIVQYRDKHVDTGQMIQIATRLHEITKSAGVPLLINDRIDVALAAGVEGVHIGQDDMQISEARQLLGPHAIIGVTASSIEEAERALKDGADYLGIGTMFGTPTKADAKSIIGTQGTRNILAVCQTGTACSAPCVAIGGINARNVQRILHQTTTTLSIPTNSNGQTFHILSASENRLNGVAVVSAIMGAEDPEGAAKDLKHRIQTFGDVFYSAARPKQTIMSKMAAVLDQTICIIKKHASAGVLCHNMTNTVVQNFAANVCLATGSSPIMSMNGAEAADLAKLGGGLVVNMGTVTPDILNVYLAGVQAYNAAGNPVLFDPVGGGATSVRKDAIALLLRGGFFDVIKGNEGEISAVMGVTKTQQRGVDSGPSTSTPEEKARMVRELAQRERCIVLMSGVTDYLSDGTRTLAISNGSHWLGQITGSGCSLGSVIASYVASSRDDKFIAALSAILHYEIAAERAAANPVCKGPGSFIPCFLDELYHVKELVSKGDTGIITRSARLHWISQSVLTS